MITGMITFYLHLIEQNTIWMQPGQGTGTSTLDMQCEQLVKRDSPLR